MVGEAERRGDTLHMLGKYGYGLGLSEFSDRELCPEVFCWKAWLLLQTESLCRDQVAVP